MNAASTHRTNPLVSELFNSLESVPGWGKMVRLLDSFYNRRFRKNNGKKNPPDILAGKFFYRTGVIVIICKGNICRSPFLAEYLKKKAQGEAISFDSAGLRSLANGKPPLHAIASAAEFGVDLSSHQAKPLLDDAVAAADLIIGMEPIHHLEFCLRYFKHRQKFLLLRELEVEWDSVKLADPYGRDREAFQQCYELLARNGDVLLSAIQNLGEKNTI